MQEYNFVKQLENTRIINKLTRDYHANLSADDEALARWLKDKGLRDVLFVINAYLEDGAGRNLPFIQKLLYHFPKKDRESLCTFTPFMSLVLLMQHEDILTPKIADFLEERALNIMDYNLLPSWDFVGVNDNTPAMMMALLILAGERYNNEIWLNAGLKRLKQFEDMQKDRTFISEFNSPTYHAVTIFAFASLVQQAKDSDIKKRALICEHGLWETTFMLYHRDTYQVAGPYARAYKVDSCGHTHQYRMIMYQLMGDLLAVNPVNTIFRTKDGFDGICIHGRENDTFFLHFSNVWLANMEYHCPKGYIDEALSREYPKFITGNAQVSGAADTHLLAEFSGEDSLLTEDLSTMLMQDDIFEYAPGQTRIFTYLQKLYAMGSCTKEFHNGAQTDSFHVLISKQSPAKSQEDITAIYSRLLINGGHLKYDVIHDCGRKLAFQHKNTAMVLYSPKVDEQEISSIKLSILIDNRFSNISEIVSEGKRLEINDTVSAKSPMFVRLEDVYCCFFPLTCDKAEKVKIEKIDTAVSLSIISYEGEAVHMYRKGLKLTPSGFVCEIRNKEEAGDFESFIKEMEVAVIEDCLYANLHTRYAFHRKTDYKRGNTHLECCYSPVSEGIQYIRVNERPIVY